MHFTVIVLLVSAELCYISFVNSQVNPCYTSTFVFDNDFPAMLDSSPAPGKCPEFVDFQFSTVHIPYSVHIVDIVLISDQLDVFLQPVVIQ